MKTHRIWTLVLSLALALGISAPVAGAAPVPNLRGAAEQSCLDTVSTRNTIAFDDVLASDYFADAVEWAVTQSITNGTGQNRFSPNSKVTRADAVTFLWRAAGSPTPGAGTASFTDVADAGTYYYNAVLWAAEQGIANGVGEGRFAPDSTLTYAHIFAFLCRFAGKETSGSNWSDAAVNWARQSGLTRGLTFRADDGCPRRDVVYCLWQQMSADTQETPSAEDPEQEQTGEQPVLSNAQGAEAAIINHLLRRASDINLQAYSLSTEQLDVLMDKILNDARPSYFHSGNDYCVSGYTCVSSSDTQLVTKIVVQYFSGEEQQEYNKIQDAIAAAQRIVQQVVTPEMSDYDIVKTLHDYLVLNCKYDMRLYTDSLPPTAYTGYGALIDGTAVCDGYAQAYAFMLEAAGIPCEFASGGNHGWNLVEVDGAWYHVDTTWDDPVPNRDGYVRYDYFLKSDAYMRRDHTWTSDRACTSTKYDKVDLPDSFEQARLEEAEKKQQMLLQICKTGMEQFPYQTQAELQTLTREQLQKIRVQYIQVPEKTYTYQDVSAMRSTVEEIVAQHNPDYMMQNIVLRPLRIQIIRMDVELALQRMDEEAQLEAEKQEQGQEQEQEQEQGQEQEQEEQRREARIQEICAALEKELLTGNVEEKVVLLSDYTIPELETACARMLTDGYRFGDYCYDSSAEYPDYHLTYWGPGKVKVENIKWAEEEIAYYLGLIQDAIRRSDDSISIPCRKYVDKVGSYYADIAAQRMAMEGYTFDGYTCGVDYSITDCDDAWDRDEYIITVQYPTEILSEEMPFTENPAV